MTDLMFQKLNTPSDPWTTIAVSDGDLRAATRLLRTIASAGQNPSGDAAVGEAQDLAAPLDRATLTARASKMFALRRRRCQIFGVGMFGEPAWDMLVALYVVDATGPKATIGRLSEVTRTALTTAIRWLEYLEQQGLVRRESSPTDRRVVFVQLTDKGRSAMEEFLSGTGL